MNNKFYFSKKSCGRNKKLGSILIRVVFLLNNLHNPKYQELEFNETFCPKQKIIKIYTAYVKPFDRNGDIIS